jgi:hypothetical protein
MVRAPSRALLAACVGVIALAGACGGGESESEAPVAHGSARRGVGPAAREVCSTMVRESVPASVGLALVGDPVSSVRGDIFSCRYTFDGGTLDLTVRDLHTLPDAREYFRELRGREGVGDALTGLAAGGFTRADGAVVAMKDAMVLTVDPTGLPTAGTERVNVGIDVAATVLHCW